MILILCTDERGGMLFNRRRQTWDRVVASDVLAEAAGRQLWMNAYSYKQFAPLGAQVRVDEAFLEKAAPGDVCFVEQGPLAPWQSRAEGIVRYRWERTYPADLRLDLDLSAPPWQLRQVTELTGHSHERITKEVYTR